MITDNPTNTAKFRRVETLAVGGSHGCYPELRLTFVADDVNMRRLVSVGGVSENSVWTVRDRGFDRIGSDRRLELD